MLALSVALVTTPGCAQRPQADAGASEAASSSGETASLDSYLASEALATLPDIDGKLGELREASLAGDTTRANELNSEIAELCDGIFSVRDVPEAAGAHHDAVVSAARSYRAASKALVLATYATSASDAEGVERYTGDADKAIEEAAGYVGQASDELAKIDGTSK